MSINPEDQPMKTHLPIGCNRAVNSKKLFRVSAWRGGTYGLRILTGSLEPKYDLELFRQYRQVVLLLPNGKSATANITSSFRSGTCYELRSAKIGRWLVDEKYAPWKGNSPPRFSLRHVGGNKCEVTK